jgi:fatty-acyl-CoA synthase
VICDKDYRDAVTAAAGPDMPVVMTDGENNLRSLLASRVPATRTTHDPDATAMLIYTSGTTGAPKGVCISHRMLALARHAEIISPYYENWKSDDVVLSPMPNFHVGGLSWMLGAFCRGLTCVLTGDASPKALLALARNHDIARVFIVPTVVRGILEEMQAQSLCLPALKEIHYGAAPMDAALLQDSIDKLDCHFLQHYGMTENAGSATRLGPGDHDLARPHLLRSVGRPQAGLTLEIRRPDGDLAQRGEAGEIWLQSPTVMQGYWHREEATRDVLVDGWYRTGDGGYLDADGFLYLTDRIKDMVVSGGENIYPAEVEAALRQHEAVKDVAVFGMPDPHWGERVAAAVEFHDGQWATEVQLASHVRTLIASYKVPKRFLLGVVLPRTAMGKTQRGEARKQALAADIGAPGKPPLDTQ